MTHLSSLIVWLLQFQKICWAMWITSQGHFAHKKESPMRNQAFLWLLVISLPIVSFVWWKKMMYVHHFSHMPGAPVASCYPFPTLRVCALFLFCLGRVGGFEVHINRKAPFIFLRAHLFFCTSQGSTFVWLLHTWIWHHSLILPRSSGISGIHLECSWQRSLSMQQVSE